MSTTTTTTTTRSKSHHPLETLSTLLPSSSSSSLMVKNYHPAVGTVTAAALSSSSSSSSSQGRRLQRILHAPQHPLQKVVSPTSMSATELPLDHVETLDATTTPSQQPPQPQHLVLIGGGHAHVQVLKALHRGVRPPHLQITLIDQVASASYSGMVPGCIAGHYHMRETQLRLAPLTEYSDIQFRQGTVVDIDLQNKLIYLKNDEDRPVAFDVISIDIGSTSRGYTTCPGAMSYAIPTRPIDQLIDKLDQARQHELLLQQQQQQQDPLRKKRQLVVIGGGIAGIELAMTIASRWEKDMIPFDTCTIIDASETLLPHEHEATRHIVQNKLLSKHIQVQYQSKVTHIDENYVYTKSSDVDTSATEHTGTIPYSLCIWSTGAGAHSLSQRLHEQRQLDCDPQSYWIRVHSTLQSTSHPFVFAAGDCCTIVPRNKNTTPLPSPPKAGVYAVRSGPILIENLTRYLESIRRTITTTNKKDPLSTSDSDDTLTLLEYKPQDDFLKLLVCGDGTAIGFRFGLVLQGAWVFRLKDDIDQSFMQLFNVSGLVKPQYVETSPDQPVIGQYDTQQYDKNTNVMHQLTTMTLDPYDAAALLRRTDNDADITTVRWILSQMGNDMAYRNAVVDSFYLQQQQLPTTNTQLQPQIV